jgi:catechol 2,3-dioxygenase-like lactoylglutathione lyase family enzyme
VPRLDHVVIAVSDAERSNAFYRDVVGVDVIDRGDGFVYGLGGRQRLHVHSPGISAYPVARVPVPPGGSDLCIVWEGPIEEVLGAPPAVRRRDRRRPGGAGGSGRLG